MIELAAGLHTDLADITAMMPPSSEETRSKASSSEMLSDRDIVSISDEARNAIDKLTSASASGSQAGSHDTNSHDADAALERAAKILAEHRSPTISGGAGEGKVPVTDAQKQLRNAVFVGFLKDCSSLYTEEELDVYNQRIQAVNGDALTASPDLFSEDEINDGLERLKKDSKEKTQVAKEKARVQVEDYLQHNQTSFSGVTERGTKFTLQLEVAEDHTSLGPYTMTFTRTDGTTESFSFAENRGFRELEDGTIVQFGEKKFQDANGNQDHVLDGSEGQDILISFGEANVKGRGGNDLIFALGVLHRDYHPKERRELRAEVDGKIDGGDGDDTIYIAGDDRWSSSIETYGGNGNDTITFRAGSLMGGMIGRRGEGIIDGGDGDDTISLGGTITRDASVQGGAGNDKISVSSSGDIWIGGKLDGGDGDDTISVTGKNIDVWRLSGGGGDDTITLKAEGTAAFKNIYGGSGNDSISIEGENIEVFLGGFLNGGEGDDSIKLKANQIITKYLRIDGGKGFDKIQLDAKIIKMMDSYIHGGGGGDTIKITGSDVDLKRTDVSDAGENGSVIIKADNLSILGGRFGNRTFISSRKASIKYANVFGQTFRGSGTDKP